MPTYEELVAPIVNRCFLGSSEDLSEIPDGVVQMVCTSPPYWGLRDYGTARWEGGHPDCDHDKLRKSGSPGSVAMFQERRHGRFADRQTGECSKCGAIRVDSQIGLEDTLDAFIERMVGVFREIRRVLRDDGVIWVNMGDAWFSGAGGVGTSGFGGGDQGDRWSDKGTECPPHRSLAAGRKMGVKPKDLLMQPARLALALQADGWVLRDEIVWFKPNPMPESVTDRTTRCHEMLYLFAKSNDTQFWTHRDGLPGTRKKPAPDYRWLDRANGNEETEYEPHEWRAETFNNPATGKTERRWRRVNLWEGHDYFYDQTAIREPLTSGPSDLRKMMNGDQRIGGRTIGNDDALYKANESTNIGKKRGVGGGFQNVNKQDLMGARFEGFNDRWRAGLIRDPNFGHPQLIDFDREEPAYGGVGFHDHSDDLQRGNRMTHAPSTTHPLGRNKRSVWEIATEPYRDAHFATFATELPANCISAGSSEWGCCSECGAPYTRVLERPNAGSRNMVRGEDGQQERQPGVDNDLYSEAISVGWTPSCEHVDAPIVPCIVADFFMGSGTVAEVAESMMRRWCGKELNPKYHALIEQRTRQAGLFTVTHEETAKQ